MKKKKELYQEKMPVKTEGGRSAPTAVDDVWKETDTVMVIGFSLLLLLAMSVQTGRMSVILTVLALVACVGKKPFQALREKLCLPLLCLPGLALMQGLAAIYSPFGGSALAEFYKFSAAFALSVILLVRYEKKHVRGLLWGFACVAAFLALVSVDAVGGGLLFGGFKAVTEAMGGEFSSLVQYEGAFRVAGIYNDANVTANLFALGGTAALYLLHTTDSRKMQAISAALSGILGMAFFLSVSRGAILCLALAWLIWLFAEKAERRMELFLRIVATVVSVGALSLLALRESNESMLPFLLVLAAGVPLFLLNMAVRPVAVVLKIHRKGLRVGIALLAVVAVGYGVAAMKLTAPVRFADTGVVLRCVTLAPGEYSLRAEWEGSPITAYIYSKTEQQALLQTETSLYSGSLDCAAFAVTDDDAEVYIRLSGKEDAVLYGLVVSDGTEIPLSYRLLPGVLATRLQGNLFRDSSYLLRVQYVKDAWTLFLKSPLLGHGLSSSENLYLSVQPFRYDSVYVHNHVLQYLCDTGLTGGLFFLLMMGGVLWLLLRSRKKDEGSLAAMLIACWVMMNIHSLMEINFSIRGYLCFALVLTMLSILFCGGEMALIRKEPQAKRCAAALLCAVMLYLAVFGGLLMSKRTIDKEINRFSTNSATEFLSMMQKGVRRDVFNPMQLQLNFVASLAESEEPNYLPTVERYVKALRGYGTYTACSGLARHYYLPRGEYEELFACSREGIAQVAASNDGWNLQLNFYRNEVLPAISPEEIDVYVTGVLALQDYLEEHNEGMLEKIRLSEENQRFLDLVDQIVGSGASGAHLHKQLVAAVQ